MTPTPEPKRIQRQRTRGWRMPENTVYVGRPTRWGNHHAVGKPHLVHGWPMSRQEAVDLYRLFLQRSMPEWIVDAQHELRGKNLACWCPLDQPCHADVLLELANQGAKP